MNLKLKGIWSPFKQEFKFAWIRVTDADHLHNRACAELENFILRFFTAHYASFS